MASSGATSSSSYDVFINFRGADTRANFVTLLYDALRTAGIYAFIDSKELRVGEEIYPSLLRAIRGSKISIPVFSEHYADGKYCLLELAEIWKCHLSDGQTVLPIFIDVEPGDVRHQTGSFQGSFLVHERKYKSEDVKTWKNALTEVGSLRGWTLKGDATIEDKSNLVKEIVKRVLREQSGSPLDECKHLIGIDSYINELLSLLNFGSNDVRFVAICGVGGLGKTTIAKVIYNRIFRSFNGSSFLINVREEASHGDNGLVSLQNRLLKDILKRDHNVSNCSQGSNLIKRLLHVKKVLLILDDVDDHVQLEVLAGGSDWFGQGSRVIITTRNNHSLYGHKFDKDIQIYEPRELDFENSLQLLSLNALSMNESPEKYRQLSQEIVRYAGGLPLTLEVLGNFLFGKDKEEWEDTLKGLRHIPNDKDFGKLKISYDKLSGDSKIIFLDIACHFTGWIVEEAIPIWEACELSPRLAIKELTQKHLLKIESDVFFRMHDQLQYMGKRIATENSYGDPRNHTRLWSCDEILKILKEGKGTKMVEGILFDWNFKSEAEDNLSYEDFANMPNLRFLNVYPIDNLNGYFSDLPSKLRWFSWHHCPLTVLPPNFYHEELVHLELSQSRIKLAWIDKPQNKNKRFQKLKVLDLTSCQDFSISPNFFSWFPCLQRLDLTSCSSLSELPDSICQIASLNSLILSYCVSFNKLPTSIGDLKHLVKLYVNRTNIEELPEGVGQLEKLEELDVSDCPKLVRLPTSMVRMRSLLHFDMSDTMIVKVTDDFSKLSSLQVFRMGMVKPDDELDYKRLEPLPICLSGFPSQLQNLYLEGYANLEFLPELPSTLTRMEAKNCISLRIISDLSHLERLKELLLDDCESLVRLPDLSNLKRLRKFCVSNCENLEEVHGIEGTDSLEELEVKGYPKLTKLSDLENLKRLRKFCVRNCETLEEVHGLKGTDSLEELEVKGCPKLTELPNLANLKILRKFCTSNCENLEEIHGLEGTELLEELEVEGCPKLTELSDLANLKRLRKFCVSNCENLEEVHGLEGTESLEELEVKGCPKLTELSDLANLKKLRKLCISNCENLEEVHSLKGTESLEEMEVKGCPKLTELSDLANLKILRIFCISNCENLEEVHGLKGTESLEELEVKGCPKLTELPDLSNLKRLKKFCLSSVEVLNMGKSLQILPISKSGFPSQLQELFLTGYMNLESLPELPSTLTRLEVEQSDFSLCLNLKTSKVKSKKGFGLQQMLRQQPNMDSDVQGFPSDIEEAEKTTRTLNFFGSSFGGVRGPDSVTEEEVKAVWDRFCNRFSTRFFVMRPYSLLLVLFFSFIALVLFCVWRFYSSGDMLLLPPPT